MRCSALIALLAISQAIAHPFDVIPSDLTDEYNVPGFVCPPADIAAGCKGPSDCLYPHPTVCSKFILCELDPTEGAGNPVVKDCPLGLFWNQNIKYCDWPEHSTCPHPPTLPPPYTKPPTTKRTTTVRPTGTATNPTPPKPPTQPSVPGFICPPGDMQAGCKGPKDCLYPDPTDCSRFIHCEPTDVECVGNPVVKECPFGLFWNDKLKLCDYPANSTCPIPPTLPTPIPQPTTKPPKTTRPPTPIIPTLPPTTQAPTRPPPTSSTRPPTPIIPTLPPTTQTPTRPPPTPTRTSTFPTFPTTVGGCMCPCPCPGNSTRSYYH